jgi:hypothetical protein
VLYGPSRLACDQRVGVVRAFMPNVPACDELLGVLDEHHDHAKAELAEAGCGSRLIPLFALPGADRRCSAGRIEGSI